MVEVVKVKVGWKLAVEAEEGTSDWLVELRLKDVSEGKVVSHRLRGLMLLVCNGGLRLGLSTWRPSGIFLH